jgi:hypothetical protein
MNTHRFISKYRMDLLSTPTSQNQPADAELPYLGYTLRTACLLSESMINMLVQLQGNKYMDLLSNPGLLLLSV